MLTLSASDLQEKCITCGAILQNPSIADFSRKDLLKQLPTDRLGEEQNIHIIDIKPCLQIGPTCGFSVISMLVGHHSQLQQKKSTGHCENCTLQQALTFAKENEWTQSGELFDIHFLQLILEKKYDISSVIKNLTHSDFHKLLESIDQQNPVVFAYDADKNHHPCCKKGHSAHWALICGYLLAPKIPNHWDGKQMLKPMDSASLTTKSSSSPSFLSQKDPESIFFFCQHGKSRRTFLFHWPEMYQSNTNLTEPNPSKAKEIWNGSNRYRCPPTLENLNGLFLFTKINNKC
eukprot:Sdes_comp10189_c0_seq1m1804